MRRERVTEGSSLAIAPFTIPIPATSPVTALTTATLTFYDLGTYNPNTSPATGIINGRDGQDVLNVNDVTISELGIVHWAMQPEDAVIVTPRRQVERHRAEFSFAWDGGAFNYQLEIEVVNLRKAQ